MNECGSSSRNFLYSGPLAGILRCTPCLAAWSDVHKRHTIQLHACVRIGPGCVYNQPTNWGPGNIQPYPFLPIRLDSFRTADAHADLILEPSSVVCSFRATNVDETSVPYRCHLRSAAHWRGMFCA